MHTPEITPLGSTLRAPTGIGVNHVVTTPPNIKHIAEDNTPPPAPYIIKFAADTTMTAYAYLSLYTVFYSVLLFYVHYIIVYY